MKTLIFTSHPSSDGFTHTIANQYAGTKKAQNNTVEIINLYDEKWKLDFLTFPENNKEPINKKLEYGHGKIANTTLEKIQEKISESDELVFIFPLWWGEAPAVLKNMIDNVFVSGFAFEFEEGKKIQKKLLIGKTAQIFVTCDAPQIYYWFKGYPFKTTWKAFILGFCGIELKNFEIFGSMRDKDENSKKKLLEKVTKIALQ